MGVELVKAAMVYGRNLSGNGFKALVSMSMSSLDKPNAEGRPAGVYWGGWDALAVALGHENADRNSAGHRAVRRAVRELRDGGHVTPMGMASKGSRQSYSVHPGGLNKPVDNPAKGDQNDPAMPEVKGDHFDPVMGDQKGPVMGDQKCPQWGTKMTPPRKELGEKGLIPDSTTPSRAQVKAARPEPVEKHTFKGRPGNDCEVCGKSHLNRAIHPLRLVEGA